MQHNRNNPTVNAVVNWWVSLHADHGDRGARARLKRCESVFDALLEPETHRLIASVHEKATAGHALEQRLAVLAMALARVKPSERTAHLPPFADALGLTWDGSIPKGDARPRLSPMRFSNLLKDGTDVDMFARALRRTLAILGDAPFDVPRFIGDVLFFNDQTRQKWTFDYYHTRRTDAAENTQPQEETQL